MRQGSRRLVHAADAQAQTFGLYPGLTVAVAQVMQPHVTVIDADLPPDQAGLERLAIWAFRYTPLVATDPPDGLVMDVAGTAHLHGGEVALLREVTQWLARVGPALRVPHNRVDEVHGGGPDPRGIIAAAVGPRAKEDYNPDLRFDSDQGIRIMPRNFR